MLENLTDSQKAFWHHAMSEVTEGWTIDRKSFCSNPKTPEYLFYYGNLMGLYFYVYTIPNGSVNISFGVFQSESVDDIDIQFTEQFNYEVETPHDCELLMKSFNIYNTEWKKLIADLDTEETRIPTYERVRQSTS